MELLPAFAIMLRRVGVSGMRAVVQRSITFGGRKTSVTLEDAFWEALKEIAYSRRMTISDLVREIDAQRRHNNLSSAIRLFVLEFYRKGTARSSSVICCIRTAEYRVTKLAAARM